MGDILEWAKKEVEIACKRENPNRKKGEFDYERRKKCKKE